MTNSVSTNVGRKPQALEWRAIPLGAGILTIFAVGVFIMWMLYP